MPDDLLDHAREQAERSSPDVRAAALLRIARVESATDLDRARRTFKQGLDEVRRLSGLDLEFLLGQACMVAAAVAPDLLSEFPPSGRPPRKFLAEQLCCIMFAHGHVDEAFEYLVRHDLPSTFPHGAVLPLMQRLGDEARRLAVLHSAMDAWRAAPDHTFVWVFQTQWKVLPPEEAQAVAREIVRMTLDEPDQPTMATYDQERTVRITSSREDNLFQILHLLRHLDEPLAESLIAGHEQLAAAARRFPNGMESVREEAQARATASGASCGGGYIMSGRPEDMPYLKALVQASRDGDFGPPIEHAIEEYRQDTAPDGPNEAPREFWPSTCRFRGILFDAGKRLGRDAAVYLDRVPDADLRLFAQIELAAALAGLPEFQGTLRPKRPRSGLR